MPFVLPPFYPILDVDVAAEHGWQADDLARACFDAGVGIVQVRAKSLGSAAFLALCDRIVRLAEPVRAMVVVNDRADVAALSGAGGVHVGQEDLTPAAVRAVCGPEIAVGLSTHTAAQIEAARADAIDYLAIGPVFDTGTKATGYDAVGLDLVRRAAANRAGHPVVAIGGITMERAHDVLGAGAASVAVITDLFRDGPPVSRIREWMRRVEGR
jgi:thiamine-phosphate pyrophosphorylase